MIGELVGGYRIESELGSGGMGTVYLAQSEDAATGQPPGTQVAVKVVHPHLVSRADIVQRFMREAAVGAQIEHPNVVRTLGSGAHASAGREFHYLVMEYVEGQTLRALLSDLGRLPEELCRRVGRGTADALSAIHAAGIVHRDVKPSNLLITEDNRVLLMDLGFAKPMEELFLLSQAGDFVGSVLYAAPEQFAGRMERIDGRADLYSLGITLYELCTGRHPFAEQTVHGPVRRHFDRPPRSAGSINPQLSPFFEEVLNALLQADRDTRFENAAELTEILTEHEQGPWWVQRARTIRAATGRPLRRIHLARITGLHGREDELQKLHDLFGNVRASRGQLCLLVGEAGIGKTRIVDEFVNQIRERGEDVHFLYGANAPTTAATASGAFVSAFAEHFGLEDLEGSLAKVLDGRSRIIPAFAALLRGETLRSSHPESPAPEARASPFVQTTRALAGKMPTVILIDDLHFASDEERALFATLALAIQEHPVLLVGTARHGVTGPWLSEVERMGHATRIELERLGPKHLTRLLVDALGSAELAQELAYDISAKSDGNPFFVFEILRGLREARAIERKPDGSWVRAGDRRDIVIPSSIIELVQARIRELSEEDKDLLDLAACAGFEFDPALVARAAGMDTIAALKAFGRIERHHRLVRATGRQYVFDHHQIHQALYKGLFEQLREHYHGALGEALEGTLGAADPDVATLDIVLVLRLADHFSQSATPQRAVRYLDPALDHLDRTRRESAGTALVQRMLDVHGLLGGEERVDALLRRAGFADRRGDREAQRSALDEALAVAQTLDPLALEGRVLQSLGTHHVTLGEYDLAEDRFRESLELALEVGSIRLQAACHGGLGQVAWSQGRLDDARLHFLRDLELCQQRDDKHGEMRATGNVGMVLRAECRLADARERVERYLELARELRTRASESVGTGNLGNILLAEGRFQEAEKVYTTSVAMAREAGDLRAEAVMSGNLGIAKQNLGKLRDGMTLHARHLQLARELELAQAIMIALSNVSSTESILGRIEDSERSINEMLELARDSGSPYFEAVALSQIADVQRLRDMPESAERTIQESLNLFESIGVRDELLPNLLIQRGALEAARGDLDAAQHSLEQAIAVTRERPAAGVLPMALAHLCAMGRLSAEGLAELRELGEEGIAVASAVQYRFLIHKGLGEAGDLDRAAAHLQYLRDHAPPEDRGTMVERVPLHRDVLAAVAQRESDS